jgi:hypothetical protein
MSGGLSAMVNILQLDNPAPFHIDDDQLCDHCDLLLGSYA